MILSTIFNVVSWGIMARLINSSIKYDEAWMQDTYTIGVLGVFWHSKKKKKKTQRSKSVPQQGPSGTWHLF